MIQFFMDDAQIIADLRDKIRNLEERLIALEKEQRMIREDILSGNSRERMHKRILQKPPGKREDYKEKISKQIKIEI